MSYQTDEKIQTNSSNSCIKLVTEQAIEVFHRLCPVFDHQIWIIANMNQVMNVMSCPFSKCSGSGFRRQSPSPASFLIVQMNMSYIFKNISISLFTTNQPATRNERMCTYSQNAMPFCSFSFNESHISHMLNTFSYMEYIQKYTRGVTFQKNKTNQTAE